ncbi:MAG: demethoxyubiquinone hydroxylase family protein [Alphaproteobacteria bacterium]|nr:demethoxyubiquinone hydroxylase family protein [Alphaproteobacteria bacterium]
MKRLPGGRTRKARIEAMVRVNHAGEYGARRIYEGQLAVLGRGPAGPVLRHMARQEARHLAYFEAEIAARRVRPTALQPFWHLAGFALGAATAALGERAAMACTVAVEEAIDEHYAGQLDELEGREPELAAAIGEFRAEELEHRDTALAAGAERAPAYGVLYRAVNTASKLAIALSTRI